MDEEIKKKFEAIEKRLNALEGKKIEQKEEIKENKKEKFSGLGGGINLIIKNGFFNTPKTLNEIYQDLKREGYHHSLSSVAKMLSVNFTKNKKILNRIKEDKVWKYVLRK